MHKFLTQKFYFIDKFNVNHINNLEVNTSIIYRNYSKKINVNEILNLRIYCKKKRKKLYLSNNIKLALKLKLDGVYIPSFNKSFRHLSYNFNKTFEILGSAHNIKEIRTKEYQNVERLFISSLFKKNKNYLGLYRFKNLCSLSKKKIVALGGISNSNLKKLKLIKCYEFSGIRYFQKKRPQIMGPF